MPARIHFLFLEIKLKTHFMHFHFQFPSQSCFSSFKALRLSISLHVCKTLSKKDTAVTIKVTYLPLPQGLQTELHNADKPRKTPN